MCYFIQSPSESVSERTRLSQRSPAGGVGFRLLYELETWNLLSGKTVKNLLNEPLSNFNSLCFITDITQNHQTAKFLNPSQVKTSGFGLFPKKSLGLGPTYGSE